MRTDSQITLALPYLTAAAANGELSAVHNAGGCILPSGIAGGCVGAFMLVLSGGLSYATCCTMLPPQCLVSNSPSSQMLWTGAAVWMEEPRRYRRPQTGIIAAVARMNLNTVCCYEHRDKETMSLMEVRAGKCTPQRESAKSKWSRDAQLHLRSARFHRPVCSCVHFVDVRCINFAYSCVYRLFSRKCVVLMSARTSNHRVPGYELQRVC